MSTYRKPSIDLGLHLLANARRQLSESGHPDADRPMNNSQIAEFITDVTGEPVTGALIGIYHRRALGKLRRQVNRYDELRQL